MYSLYYVLRKYMKKQFLSTRIQYFLLSNQIIARIHRNLGYFLKDELSWLSFKYEKSVKKW